jgi:hypothetical protein
MKRIKRTTALSSCFPDRVQTEEEVQKALENHNPYLFSSINFVNRHKDIDVEMKNFSNRLEDFSTILGNHNQKYRRKLEKLKEKEKEEKEKVKKMAPRRLVSLDFNNAMIKRLISNSNFQNMNLINEVINGKKTSFTLPNDKDFKDQMQLNVEFLKTYIKKENTIKKQMMKFKENKIYEFRNKYTLRSSKKQNASVDESEPSSSDSESVVLEMPNIKNRFTNYAKTEVSSIPSPERKRDSLSTFIQTPKIVKFAKLDFLDSPNKIETLKTLNSRNPSVFSKYLSTKQNACSRVNTDCSQLYDDIEKAEILSRQLQNKLTKKMKRPFNSPDKTWADTITNPPSGAQLIRTAFGGAKKKRLNFNDKNKTQVKILSTSQGQTSFKQSYDLITNMEDVKAFQNKEALIKKYNIKYNPDEFTFKILNTPKLKKIEDNKHKKVNGILNDLEMKKRNLMTKIDRIQTQFIK